MTDTVVRVGEADLPAAPYSLGVGAPEGLPTREGSLTTIGSLLEEVAGTAVLRGLDQSEETVDRSGEVFRLERNPETYEISVESDLTLEDYRKTTNPEDLQQLLEWAKPLEGNGVVFINPTMEGGGVAMMRPPVVHLMRLLGIDAHWFVMEHTQPNGQEPFIFTKQMHNISQRVTSERITDEGKALHWQWADGDNGPVLERQEVIRAADFIIIDDPQPAPLISRLKAANPEAELIWRNHIDTDGELMADPATPQGEVASYLLYGCGVVLADAVIAHPSESFIHRELNGVTYFSPATLERFDNLNRELTEAEIHSGIDFINSEIAEKNRQLALAGEKDVIPLLDTDPKRNRITLIARFDPSKRMDIAMEMGVQTRRLMREAGVSEAELPEVVIVGNGSVDDPDGGPMFEQMLELRRTQYPDEMDGIKIMRLKHNYDAMNALMRRSSILMQTSEAEGLETRVSDAIVHGKPVVVSNRGGIKTQVVEGKSGIVLDYDNLDAELARGAQFMSNLLLDEVAYKVMVASTIETAEELNKREFVTTANVARFLRIFNNLLTGKPADKLWKMEDISKARDEDFTLVT